MKVRSIPTCKLTRTTNHVSQAQGLGDNYKLCTTHTFKYSCRHALHKSTSTRTNCAGQRHLQHLLEQWHKGVLRVRKRNRNNKKNSSNKNMHYPYM